MASRVRVAAHGRREFVRALARASIASQQPRSAFGFVARQPCTRRRFAQDQDPTCAGDRAYVESSPSIRVAPNLSQSLIAQLRRVNVDRTHGRVTLRREHSKNGEPRVLPLTPALAGIIERQWQARQITHEDGSVTLSSFVFHRAGSPVGDFRKAWAAACKEAGVAGTLFDDLRRSAVRNMERAGVSQAVAMKVTGHKTASVYRRYRIVDESDVREALAKTEAANNRQAERSVMSLSAARDGVR